uniref:Sperm-associated antigen 6 n=1 Tax=Clastoptera arizonana TaxID=38151 RepID=A0A1B6DNB5_9HEMI
MKIHYTFYIYNSCKTSKHKKLNSYTIYMAARSILAAFKEYEKSRLLFVQCMADTSTRAQCADYLVDMHAIELLLPLLSDIVPNIQKYFKKSAMFLLRCLAKHSADLAETIVTNRGLDIIIHCVDHLDPAIKESAVWALGNIAKHNNQLARAVEKAGSIPLLILCLQEPELCLKQVAVSALCDISKHSIDLAQSVMGAGGIPHLVKVLNNPDPKLKKKVFFTLGNICKHSLDLTETVVEADVMPVVFKHLLDSDPQVSRAAVMLIKEMVKHSLQMAHFVVDSGGLKPIIMIASKNKGSIRLPAIITLGFIAGHSEPLALAVIESQAVTELALILMDDEEEDHVISAAVWTVFCIGKHSPLHTRSITKTDIFARLIQLLKSKKSSEDLKTKCKTTLKLCIHKCTDPEALEPLLKLATPEIFKHVISQYSKILPINASARRVFAASGSLRMLQQIQPEPGSNLMEHINIINSCFPEEMIRYYSPNYPESLLQQLDNYNPQIPTKITPYKKSIDEDLDPPTLPPSEY